MVMIVHITSLVEASTLCGLVCRCILLATNNVGMLHKQRDFY